MFIIKTKEDIFTFSQQPWWHVYDPKQPWCYHCEWIAGPRDQEHVSLAGWGKWCERERTCLKYFQKMYFWGLGWLEFNTVSSVQFPVLCKIQAYKLLIKKHEAKCKWSIWRYYILSNSILLRWVLIKQHSNY